MLVNHLTAGAHRIRLPKTRFSGEKTPLGHIRRPFLVRAPGAAGQNGAYVVRRTMPAPWTHPCADHVFTMFLAKGAQRQRGRPGGQRGKSAKGGWAKGRPDASLLDLMPFIPPRVQRIGSETLIAGRLRVHLPVTHRGRSESSVNAQNGLDAPQQLSHTETACWSIT